MSKYKIFIKGNQVPGWFLLEQELVELKDLILEKY